MCFINRRTNVEKNSTIYVMIEYIMIHISGAIFLKRRVVFHFGRFTTYILDTILFEKNETTKLDKYWNIIF